MAIGPIGHVAVGPHGAAWVATPNRMAHFDGEGWRTKPGLARFDGQR